MVSRGGSEAALASVEAKMPKRVKKRRPVLGEEGEAAGWEEYYDYVFPDDAGAKQPSLKLLEAAYAWKKAKAAESARADDA